MFFAQLLIIIIGLAKFFASLLGPIIQKQQGYSLGVMLASTLHVGGATVMFCGLVFVVYCSMYDHVSTVLAYIKFWCFKHEARTPKSKRCLANDYRTTVDEQQLSNKNLNRPISLCT